VQATTATENEAGGPGARRWFVYLIECVDGSLYTGIARDVAARYALHASGKGARYTRSHPPARLLCTLEFPDRSTASQAEYRIKQLKAAEKRRYFETLAASRTGPAAAAPDSCA
jgi:putative endonuclease